MTPVQVALNWVRQQPGVIIIPILGARTAAQLKNNLRPLDFELTAEQLQPLAEVSQIESGFPHDFLAQEDIRDSIYGGTFPLTENHRD